MCAVESAPAWVQTGCCPHEVVLLDHVPNGNLLELNHWPQTEGCHDAEADVARVADEDGAVGPGSYARVVQTYDVEEGNCQHYWTDEKCSHCQSNAVLAAVNMENETAETSAGRAAEVCG